jgi:hypothetical protein
MQSWYFLLHLDFSYNIFASQFAPSTPFTLPFFFPVSANVNRSSIAVASICEVARPPGGGAEHYPFVGNAIMRVLNVAPRDPADRQREQYLVLPPPNDGGIIFATMSVDWYGTLDLRVSFIIDP